MVADGRGGELLLEDVTAITTGILPMPAGSFGDGSSSYPSAGIADIQVVAQSTPKMVSDGGNGGCGLTMLRTNSAALIRHG